MCLAHRVSRLAWTRRSATVKSQEFGGSTLHVDGEYTEDCLDEFVIDLVEGELIQIQR